MILQLISDNGEILNEWNVTEDLGDMADAEARLAMCDDIGNAIVSARNNGEK
jgi:hypothetical protein